MITICQTKFTLTQPGFSDGFGQQESDQLVETDAFNRGFDQQQLVKRIFHAPPPAQAQAHQRLDDSDKSLWQIFDQKP